LIILPLRKLEVVDSLGKVCKSVHSPLRTPLWSTCIVGILFLLDPFQWILAIFEPIHQMVVFLELLCSIVVVFQTIFEGYWGHFKACCCLHLLLIVFSIICWFEVVHSIALILELSPFVPWRCCLEVPLVFLIELCLY